MLVLFICQITEILNNKTQYKKRFGSEMIYIKKQPHGLTLQNDTELLDSIYFDLVDTPPTGN